MEEKREVTYEIYVKYGYPKPRLRPSIGSIRDFTIDDARKFFLNEKNIENILWGMFTQVGIDANTLKSERVKLNFISSGNVLSDEYFSGLNKLAVYYSKNIDLFYNEVCNFTKEVCNDIEDPVSDLGGIYNY